VFVLFLIGIGFLGFATILLLRAATMNRVRTGESLAQIDGYGYVSHEVADENAPSELRATLDQLAAALGGLVPTRFGGGAAKIRRQLMTAGIYSITPSKFMGYRLLCTFAALAGWVLLGIFGFHGGVVSVLGAFVVAFVGWLAPIRFVKAKGKRRKAKIEKELPELIDLLVVTIEGGVGFTASLRMAAERLRGPIGEELRLVLQEQRMGLSTDEALRNLLDRCDTPSVRSFVRSVLQGETLGVSIGQIMRNLALEMRKRRRAAAEERAQKAPVKMLFPLILLIFPAMFVVILGPVFFELADVFG
jgi:tight adherence protein C